MASFVLLRNLGHHGWLECQASEGPNGYYVHIKSAELKIDGRVKGQGGEWPAAG